MNKTPHSLALRIARALPRFEVAGVQVVYFTSHVQQMDLIEVSFRFGDYLQEKHPEVYEELNNARMEWWRR
jgi:hypothetical protein